MTDQVQTVHQDAIMSEVVGIFETNDFHHLPVLDDQATLVGIISRSDYLQLQHQFSALKYSEAVEKNLQFFSSLTVADVMKKPVTISPNARLNAAIDVFLSNTYRSLLVVEGQKCIGIVTPYDFLRLIKAQEIKSLTS